jgi:hypothetical protein
MGRNNLVAFASGDVVEFECAAKLFESLPFAKETIRRLVEKNRGKTFKVISGNDIVTRLESDNPSRPRILPTLMLKKVDHLVI